jgi:hypothetical protein
VQLNCISSPAKGPLAELVRWSDNTRQVLSSTPRGLKNSLRCFRLGLKSPLICPGPSRGRSQIGYGAVVYRWGRGSEANSFSKGQEVQYAENPSDYKKKYRGYTQQQHI